MNQPDDDTEKSHEPSEKKLRDARKKGEIIRSTDVSTAAAYAGFWISMSMFGAAWVADLGQSLTVLLARAPELAELFLESDASIGSGAVLRQISPPLASMFGLLAAGVILVILAQQGFVFAPDKLAFKANRLSLIANAKNKFGRRGLFEFFKSFLKLTLYSAALGGFLTVYLDDIAQSVALTPGQSLGLFGTLLMQLMAIVVGIAVVLGIIDYTWQRADYMRNNRMSRKEVTDETKEAEGDPAMKAQRRAKAEEIAMNKMLAEVPRADVVVVNPTHYAIALLWDRSSGGAPTCVAKGVDSIALRIREIAQDAKVPIHDDPPTARALHATVEVGQQIEYEHFAAVAIAIRYADKARAMQKQKV